MRIDFIDLAKGLGLITIFLIHINIYIDITDSKLFIALKSFSVPLFFILSGIFFKPDLSLKSFIIKKINGLLIPFFFFYITCSVALTHLLFLFGYPVRSEHFLGFHSIWYFVWAEKPFLNEPIWFLLSLFFINFIFYFINKLTKKNLLLVSILSFCVGILGYSLSVLKIMLPLFLAEALTSTPYFFIGYIMKNKINKQYSKIYLLLISLILFFIVYFLQIDVNYLGNQFKYNILAIYCVGILGSFSVIMFSKIINKIPIISYNGQYSLIVFSTHMLLLQPIIKVINKFALLNYFGKSITVILIIFLIMTMYLFIVPLMNKFVPMFVGQKPLIKTSDTKKI